MLTEKKNYDFDRVIDRHGSGCTKFDRLKNFFGKENLTPMWIADMDFPVCPEITEALRRRIDHPIYGYSLPDEGYWGSIISWLHRRHDWEVGRHELTFVPGVVKGIAFAINFFSQRGDKILIQPPVYHPFKRVIEGNGRVVLPAPLVLDDETHTFSMDLDALEELVARERPRLMILCNPHNPVGLQWSREVLGRIGTIARRNGVVVISDEIHGDLVLYGRPHYPFAACGEDAEAVAVTFGAPSKTFNIPGLVSSWCVVKNPGLREPFFEWLEANEFDATTFVSTIGVEAAYNNGEPWLAEAMDYIEQNIRFTREFLAERMPRVKMVEPEASFLIWMDFRALGLSHDDLVILLTDHAGLALNDGEMFGPEGAGFMRVNIATPRCCLQKALEKLAEAVDSVK